MPPFVEQRRDRVQQWLDASGRYQRWVLLTALTGMFATTFPVTLLAVLVETIAEDFDTSETLIAWVISGPLLASAVALPILGKLGDLYGHRRVFLAGFTISTIITALTTQAWDPYSLIVLRGLAVVIGAATIPSSMALINSVHAPTERARAMGWWSLVAAGSPAMGLVLGGLLVQAVGWRPMFGVQALLSVIPVAAATLVLRETQRREDVGFDVLGSLTLAFGAGGAMLALNQLPERGIDGIVLTALAVGAVGIATFTIVESRVAFPLLPLGLFRRRNFTASMLGSLFSGGAYMGGFVLAPLVLQNQFGYSVAASSFMMLLRPGSFSITAPIGGSLASRIGERPVAIFGTIGITVALALIGVGARVGVLALILVALVFQGVGNGAAQPTLTATLSNSVDEHDLGVAAAAQRMMFQMGAAMGITVMTAVYGGTARAVDFFNAYVVGAGLALLAVAFAAAIRSTPRSADHDDEGSGRAAAAAGPVIVEPATTAPRT